MHRPLMSSSYSTTLLERGTRGEPGALLHQRALEVHRPILMINYRRWCLDLSPLRDEVGQRLGLDSCPGV
jgi:hypothetical protein